MQNSNNMLKCILFYDTAYIYGVSYYFDSDIDTCVDTK